MQVNDQAPVNTGITNDDGSVSGATLVTGKAGKTVPLKTTATAVPAFTFNNQAFALGLKIIDAGSGTDLTAQTNDVIVGQQMNMFCRLSITNQFMTNFPLADFQWTVPGFAVTNFYVSTDSDQTNGYPVLLAATNSQGVYFWWADGGLKQVQISATVDGKTVTGQAWFNVVRPQANIIATTGDVSLGYRVPDGLYFGICFGTTNEILPGIEFSNSLTMPLGSYNYGNTNYFIEWVQLITSNRDSIIENGTNHIKQTTGVVLDTSYDYGFSGYPNTDDSPSITLSDSGEIAASDIQVSKMWLMFRPYGGRFVPLRTVSWSFGGAATNSGIGWALTTKSWSTNPPDADAGTMYPIWTNNIKAAMWNPPF